MQVLYHPADNVGDLIRQPVLPADKQQIAEVLLTAVKPKVPQHWEVDPGQVRRQQMAGLFEQIGWAIYWNGQQGQPCLSFDKKAKAWTFAPGLLQDLVKQGRLNAAVLTDPVGQKVTLENLAILDKNFTPDRFAQAITQMRMQNLVWPVANQSNQQKAELCKDGKWKLPESLLAEAAKKQGLDKQWLRDAWGNPIKLVAREKKWEHQTGQCSSISTTSCRRDRTASWAPTTTCG